MLLDGRVEVHVTPCIVREFEACDTLVTSANETLVGARLPYFPRGGPLPKDPPQMTTNSWGGMDIGENQVYRSQCIDGILDAEAPDWRREEPLFQKSLRPGEALLTNAPKNIPYRTVVHAVAPYYNTANWEYQLQAAYIAALDRSQDSVALPLLGTGAKGVPSVRAVTIAATAVHRFFAIHNKEAPRIVRFGCLDPALASALTLAFRRLVV